MSVVKPKPKYLLHVQLQRRSNAMTESELEAKPRTRENTCEKATIGFGFASDWLRKRCEFFFFFFLSSFFFNNHRA